MKNIIVPRVAPLGHNSWHYINCHLSDINLIPFGGIRCGR
jgi:hypothetical protein